MRILKNFLIFPILLLFSFVSHSLTIECWWSKEFLTTIHNYEDAGEVTEKQVQTSSKSRDAELFTSELPIYTNDISKRIEELRNLKDNDMSNQVKNFLRQFDQFESSRILRPSRADVESNRRKRDLGFIKQSDMKNFSFSDLTEWRRIKSKFHMSTFPNHTHCTKLVVEINTNPRTYHILKGSAKTSAIRASIESHPFPSLTKEERKFRIEQIMNEGGCITKGGELFCLCLNDFCNSSPQIMKNKIIYQSFSIFIVLLISFLL
ncbi:hypothetical protein SNEBB_011441 [Seison nebaliae]|nr:hypothetical protein SNEBB_011441 [Seison nebaliae]